MYKFALMIILSMFFYTNSFAQYAPGISFSTMLNGVKMIDPEKSMFGFGTGNIQGTFLDGVKEGRIDVKKENGDLIKSYKFEPNLIKKPYYYFNIFQSDRITLPEGNYVMEFSKEDGLFYKFPFSISKVASDDPFSGTDKYFLEGDWEKWGYFYYSNANPEQMLQWKCWLRHKGTENEKSVEIKIVVTDDKTGKAICRNRDRMTYRLRSDWNRFQFDMIYPENEGIGGAYFKAKHMLANDGNYTLTLSIDDSEYAKWKFSVKDNKFVYKGRTDRKNADPTTFIEGGRDAFWYESE